MHQLTEDQKTFYDKEGYKTNETLADFLQRYFTYKNRNTSLSQEKPEKLTKNEIISGIDKLQKDIIEKNNSDLQPKISSKNYIETNRTKVKQKKSIPVSSNSQSKPPSRLINKTRICRKCGIESPLNKDYFGHTQKGNFRWTCRICMNKATQRYAKANPDSVLRRARKRQENSNNWTANDSMKKTLNQEQKGVCGLCGEQMDKDFLNNNLCQVDHLIPVAQGGSNDLSNLVLAHRTCNAEKSNKTFLQYVQWREKVGLPRSKYYSPKIKNAFSNEGNI